MRVVISLLLLSIFSPAQAQELSSEDKMSLEDRACVYAYILAMESIMGTEEEAFDVCVESAKAGARGAQNLIAEGYLGAGQRDKALYWFKKASEQGHKGARLRVRELRK